jgi:hypothetical protein
MLVPPTAAASSTIVETSALQTKLLTRGGAPERGIGEAVDRKLAARRDVDRLLKDGAQRVALVATCTKVKPRATDPFTRRGSVYSAQ